MSSNPISIPEMQLPKGGGAIQGLSDTFQVNQFTGTASFSIPLPSPEARSLTPQLSLAYSSAAGNGPFGMGFSLNLQVIGRNTSLGVPRYVNTDIFTLSGAGNLVPALDEQLQVISKTVHQDGHTFQVTQYRPDNEQQFRQIWFWEDVQTGLSYWKVTDPDNTEHTFGKNTSATVSDPDNPLRIFQWNITSSVDSKGNKIIYTYEVDVSHDPSRRWTNTYLTNVKYGNYMSGQTECFAFEIDFVYEPLVPLSAHKDLHLLRVEAAPVRSDAFSFFKAGFEIRTEKLCYTIMVSHFFKGQYNDKKILTRAVTLTYQQVLMALLEKVTQSGYEWNAGTSAYSSQELPAVELGYTPFQPDIPRDFRIMETDHHLPVPGDFNDFQLVDLYREGLPGILYSNKNAHLYFDPKGNGQYAFPQTPDAFPNNDDLNNPSYALIDIDGNGGLELVVQDGMKQGYYQYNTYTQNWDNYVNFVHPLTGVIAEDKKIVDLDGDGKQDVLIANNDNFQIFLSAGKQGYQTPVRRPHDRTFPYQYYNDSRQEHVAFTDIFGDGMSHCVRVQNGLVECWPNLGYGEFAPRVTLQHPPVFEGAFDKKRLFFADIDGSGTSDIAYVYDDRIAIYINENGNAFADPFIINLPDAFTLLDSINFADITGNGYDNLVFTKMTPAVQHFYYDFAENVLTGKSVKPYLLNTIINNLGGVRHLEYCSSTVFYLQDKKNGRPWITALPFPVQVVSNVVNEDKIAGWASVQRFAYHDGYFNAAERQFAGFGFIESWDGEPYEPYLNRVGQSWELLGEVDRSYLYAPVAYTKSWYSIGDYIHQQYILQQYQSEYFAGDPNSYNLPDSVIAADINHYDDRTMLHAYQVLHGKVLHEEVYGLDDNSQVPYTVSNSNYFVRQIQPRSDNRYPVFQVLSREILNFNYEREAADPRVEHDFILKTDHFGNTLEDCKIFYGRRTGNNNYPGQEEIKAIAGTWLYNDMPADGYVLGINCESKTYEIKGIIPQGKYFTFEEVKQQVAAALKNESGTLSSALMDWQQNYFWNMDQSECLPLQQLTVRALLHHQQQAVFKKDYIEHVEIHGEKVITATDLKEEGGYLLQDGYYWNPGMIGYYYTAADNKYFLPFRTDNNWPFIVVSKLPLQQTKVIYDDYQLKQVKQIVFLNDGENSPENHVTTALINYIFLQETQLTDINDNISQVMFDPLGHVIVTSRFKQDEVSKKIIEGDDPLSSYDTTVLKDLTLEKVLEDPSIYLQNATAFFYYDMYAWKNIQQPVCFTRLSREIYVTAGIAGHTFIEVSYNDGFGRELETKVFTAPGAAFIRDKGGSLLKNGILPLKEVVSRRWMVTGKVIYNNKGKSALEYEPYFSNTYIYEDQAEVVVALPPPKGIRYDALSREIRTDIPKVIVDGITKVFYTRTSYEAWQTVSFDMNDTVMTSDYYTWFMANYPVNPTQEEKNEKDALDKAAICQNTPNKEIFNNQGNTIFSITDNLGKVLESDVKKILRNLSPAVQDEIWLLLKSLYLDAMGYLNAVFRPYDPAFEIPVPVGLQPYQAEILEVQDFLASGCLTAHYVLDLKGRKCRFTDPRLYYSNMRHGTDYYSSKFNYDMVSEDAFLTDSCDSGQQLGLINVFNNIYKLWDARGFVIGTTYDKLQRVLATQVSGTEITPANPPVGWQPLMLNNTVELNTYGESVPDGRMKNMFGQIAVLKDQSGEITFNNYSLAGKPISYERMLLEVYNAEVNWNDSPVLSPEKYVKVFTYTEQGAILTETDMLGGDKVFGKSNTYNESGAVITVNEITYLEVKNETAPVVQSIISSIEYYPNKQPLKVQFGNGMRTDYTYEFATQRMTGIRSAANTGVAGNDLQSLQYTYDPVGNITRITDNSFKPVVACYGPQTDAIKNYWYNPLYALINATGRQHVALNSNSYLDGFKESRYLGFCPANPNDPNLLVSYKENYTYDYSGNLLSLQHITGSSSGSNWTRDNAVNANNNQLSAFPYDRNGNQLSLYTNSGSPVSWGYRNLIFSATQLQRVDYINDAEYYTYDKSGNRVRRVITAIANGSMNTEEYIYLDGWNIKRKRTADGTITEERYTRKVLAEMKQAALVHYWKTANGNHAAKTQQVRFQLNDLEGTICSEVDINANRITYEEFLPFGESAFVAGISESEMRMKDYRFTGKERDDTTGLDYFGARYYASWKGRWTSSDPEKQFASSYTYSYNNPVTAIDANGQWAWLIPIIVGGVISGYASYSSAKSNGSEGASLALHTLAGTAIGAGSGLLGGAVTASAYPLAQTLGLAASSTFSSGGLSLLSRGKTNVTTSFGVGSYNWSTGTFGYLGKRGNTKGENTGYLFGALANISDARALGNGTNVKLITEFPDVIGHSAVVNPAEGISVSVGPEDGYYNLSLPPQKLLLSLFDKIKGQVWPTYHGEPNGWAFPLYNVNKASLQATTAFIRNNSLTSNLPYSGLGYSCADYASRALFRAGVIHIPIGLHPTTLAAQLMVRQVGISASAFTTSNFNTTSAPKEEEHIV